VRARAAFPWLALCACRESSAPATEYVLAQVAKPAVAELEARLLLEPAAPEPDAELLERTSGVIAMLAGSGGRLRAAALEDARSLGSGAVPLAAATLADAGARAELRVAAADLLGGLRTVSAAVALSKELEQASDSWLRAHCARQLGVCGEDALLPRMLARLRVEKDAETVIWLSVSLARLGSYAGLDGLRVLRAQGASEELRALAAAKLEELARAAGLASGDELHERWNSPRAVELELPPPSDALRLELWRRIADLSAWNLRTVDDCRFVLARGAPWVAELLARALHDEDVYVRVHAAQCLERMGPRGAAAGPALLESLAEPRLAADAAAALAGLEYEPAAPELARKLESSADLELRIAAARALGRLRDPSTRDVLRRVLGSKAPEPIDLRQAAAQALLALGEDPAATRFLLACLTDPAADSCAAEDALGAWLERRAAGDTGAARLLERWRTLGPDAGAIPTAEEQRARQRARAELLANQLERLGR